MSFFEFGRRSNDQLPKRASGRLSTGWNVDVRSASSAPLRCALRVSMVDPTKELPAS